MSIFANVAVSLRKREEIGEFCSSEAGLDFVRNLVRKVGNLKTFETGA